METEIKKQNLTYIGDMYGARLYSDGNQNQLDLIIRHFNPKPLTNEQLEQEVDNSLGDNSLEEVEQKKKNRFFLRYFPLLAYLIVRKND